MKKFLKSHPLTIKTLPVILILLAILSYGLVIRQLGIYWDDWAYLWTKMELGYEGMVRHFSFSRPLAGQIQNIVMELTGKSPLAIQIYGLLIRILCSALVARLIYRISQKSNRSAIIGALLFMTYPGFTMQPIALNFGFSYLLISFLILSFLLTLRTMQNPDKRTLLTIAALLLSVINLFASEYFFMLELLRPVLIWIELTNNGEIGKQRWKSFFRYELPFLCVFLLGAVYRLFFNKTQTLHYEFSLIAELKNNPLSTIGTYLGSIFSDTFKVLVTAWKQIFEFPDRTSVGERTFGVYLLVCIAAFFITAAALLFIRKENPTPKNRSAIQLMLTGLIALILAGQPFWLTRSYLSFVFPNSRYTLPFILGMAFFWSGLFSVIPQHRKGFASIGILFVSVIVGFGTGSQFINANVYRRDWTLTKDFFQQLKWRIPAMEENTVLITNTLPIKFSTDNSLTAPLNWIYANSYENESIPYMLYTNTKREETLSKFEPGQLISQEYLSARFYGNTDDSISVYFNAPGCVHVLDPEIDVLNQTIPIIDREAALLNNYDRILTTIPYEPLDPVLFGEEQPKNWCWYYEHADLARQNADWEQVAKLGDQAFQLNDHPNDPMERLPFIEGYANIASWQRALDQTREAFAVTPVMNNPLCALWHRIDQTTPTSTEKQDTILTINRFLDCEFLK